MMSIPGPKMLEAVRHVAKHGPSSILPIAEAVGPYGSRRYGYAIVHRAADAGLLDLELVGGRYTVTTTDAGLNELRDA